MAYFTSTANLNILWNGLYFVGAAGVQHRFPDDFYQEFIDTFTGSIPGLVVTWPTDGGAAISTVTGSQTINTILQGTDTSGTSTWVDGRFSVELLIDGNGSSVTTGFKGFVEMPCNATILAARIFGTGSTSGSVVVDVWKDTYANYPPIAGDSICGSAKPTITNAVKSEDTTLTGWTTSVVAGDLIGFNVDSISGGFTQLTASLTLRRA